MTIFDLTFEAFKQENITAPSGTGREELEKRFASGEATKEELTGEDKLERKVKIGDAYTFSHGKFDCYVCLNLNMDVPSRVQLSRSYQGRTIYHEFSSGILNHTVVESDGESFDDNRFESNGKLRHCRIEDEIFLRQLHYGLGD